jgi:transcriptional regulator with XRE-family HTH domain
MNQKPEEIIRAARETKGWTLQEAADRLAKELNQSYSMRQYQKLEDGVFPKYKTEVVAALDKILGTDILPMVYEQTVPIHKKENPSTGNQDFQKDYIKFYQDYISKQDRIHELELYVRDLEAELKELRQVQERFDSIEDDMRFLAARILANQDVLMQQSVQFDDHQFSLLKNSANNIMLSIARLFQKEGIRAGINS